MKIRTGFVSNSSSSSFCIYGLSLGEGLGAALIKAINKEDAEDAHYEMESGENKIEVYSVDYENFYLGRPFSSIEDEETGLQFKASVVNHIRRLCEERGVPYTDIASECGVCEEAGYNG